MNSLVEEEEEDCAKKGTARRKKEVGTEKDRNSRQRDVTYALLVA